MRVFGIDWSGAVDHPERRIRLAEVRDGVLIRIEGERNREVLAAHLIEEAARDPKMVVGLDFAFSLPQWFIAGFSEGSAKAAWKRLAEGEAERILRECSAPFWGRPGKGRPRVEAEFRRTELEVGSVGGIRPKSVFQIGGAGAVGTGSLRGMPILHTLSQAGFHIWPFDPPGWPLLVEIYPRVLTGEVKKGRPEECAAYLRLHYPSIPPALFDKAAESEDSFDAVVSSLVMAEDAGHLSALPVVEDAQLQVEGIIWTPGCRSASQVRGT